MKPLLMLFIVAALIYAGVYSNVEGLNNVGVSLLWVFTIFLFIGAFASEHKEKKNINIIKKWIGRSLVSLMIFGLLYGGHIFMGICWILIILIILVKSDIAKEAVKDGK